MRWYRRKEGWAIGIAFGATEWESGLVIQLGLWELRFGRFDGGPR
jgi:hypothetical protein